MLRYAYRLAPAASLLAVLISCHQHRPAPSSPPSSATASRPASSPALDPSIDVGPVPAWYEANSRRLAFDDGASPADLSFTIDLFAWVAKGDEAAFARIAPRVERAFADPLQRPRVAIAPIAAEAGRYHAAAEPLGKRPAGERDLDLEERLYRKALLLNLADADLHNHLAVTASLRKDYRTAERWAKLAIVADPSFLSAYHELAYIYKNAERYPEAIAIAERGLNLDGDLHTKALILARQGQAYWMLGERDKALNAFQTSRRLGGPAWVASYLEGKQELGKGYVEPEGAATGE